jgi:hypothetical protein
MDVLRLVLLLFLLLSQKRASIPLAPSIIGPNNLCSIPGNKQNCHYSVQDSVCSYEMICSLILYCMKVSLSNIGLQNLEKYRIIDIEYSH